MSVDINLTGTRILMLTALTSISEGVVLIDYFLNVFIIFSLYVYLCVANINNK